MILVIPSIDIINGQCARAVQGAPAGENIYSFDPVQIATLWRGENAKTLHVVDLDGAMLGSMKNIETIQKMAVAVDIPLQVTGGIRTFEDIRHLIELGVYRIILGTVAVENQKILKDVITEFGARKIAVAIDAQDGKVYTHGRAVNTGIGVKEFARSVCALGISRIVYAELSEDGTTSSPNFEAIRSLAEGLQVRVTAAGRISGYEDLVKIQSLEKFGVDSVVVGRALYENKFSCQALWRLNEQFLTDFGPTRR